MLLIIYKLLTGTNQKIHFVSGCMSLIPSSLIVVKLRARRTILPQALDVLFTPLVICLWYIKRIERVKYNMVYKICAGTIIIQ